MSVILIPVNNMPYDRKQRSPIRARLASILWQIKFFVECHVHFLSFASHLSHQVYYSVFCTVFFLFPEFFSVFFVHNTFLRQRSSIKVLYALRIFVPWFTMGDLILLFHSILYHLVTWNTCIRATEGEGLFH